MLSIIQIYFDDENGFDNLEYSPPLKKALIIEPAMNNQTLTILSHALPFELSSDNSVALGQCLVLFYYSRAAGSNLES